ncbi:hypothetical protein H8B15_16300 [Hymenobacter sp. BT507]|uniref:Transmembrane protein n=1 Tax=Hymenobacter citatus TaxID=2763506 RepID=A0ABR7MN25_9BACT|nr:hypothetical protein [Hymenobacter citatus]MBC6612486.1 hypothetical protein [Hymenobacter citatus]
MLLLGSELHAQSAGMVKPPTASFSRSDTVRAVQRVFSSHRTGGWIWTAVGGLFAVRIASVAATSSSDAWAGSTGGTVVGIAVLGGVPAGIGVGKLTRFSQQKEEQTVVLYQQSGILPPYIRKRLKPKFFR